MLRHATPSLVLLRNGLHIEYLPPREQLVNAPTAHADRISGRPITHPAATDRNHYFLTFRIAQLNRSEATKQPVRVRRPPQDPKPQPSPHQPLLEEAPANGRQPNGFADDNHPDRQAPGGGSGHASLQHNASSIASPSWGQASRVHNGYHGANGYSRMVFNGSRHGSGQVGSYRSTTSGRTPPLTGSLPPGQVHPSLSDLWWHRPSSSTVVSFLEDSAAVADPDVQVPSPGDLNNATLWQDSSSAAAAAASTGVNGPGGAGVRPPPGSSWTVKESLETLIDELEAEEASTSGDLTDRGDASTSSPPNGHTSSSAAAADVSSSAGRAASQPPGSRRLGDWPLPGDLHLHDPAVIIYPGGSSHQRHESSAAPHSEASPTGLAGAASSTHPVTAAQDMVGAISEELGRAGGAAVAADALLDDAASAAVADAPASPSGTGAAGPPPRPPPPALPSAFSVRPKPQIATRTAAPAAAAAAGAVGTSALPSARMPLLSPPHQQAPPQHQQQQPRRRRAPAQLYSDPLTRSKRNTSTAHAAATLHAATAAAAAQPHQQQQQQQQRLRPPPAHIIISKSTSVQAMALKLVSLLQQDVAVTLVAFQPWNVKKAVETLAQARQHAIMAQGLDLSFSVAQADIEAQDVPPACRRPASRPQSPSPDGSSSPGAAAAAAADGDASSSSYRGPSAAQPAVEAEAAVPSQRPVQPPQPFSPGAAHSRSSDGHLTQIAPAAAEDAAPAASFSSRDATHQPAAPHVSHHRSQGVATSLTTVPSAGNVGTDAGSETATMLYVRLDPFEPREHPASMVAGKDTVKLRSAIALRLRKEGRASFAGVPTAAAACRILQALWLVRKDVAAAGREVVVTPQLSLKYGSTSSPPRGSGSGGGGGGGARPRASPGSQNLQHTIGLYIQQRSSQQ